jgi:type II protein arginine methyltransferase
MDDVNKAVGDVDGPLQLDGQNRDALVEKGLYFHRQGKLREAVACFEAAREIAPDDELVLTNLGAALVESRRTHEAVVAFRQALRINPNNLYVRHQLRRLISAIVPFWHIRMLNDTDRNDAFERAIRAAIAKEGHGARILDIGTGSGLLSMMAARAGAQRIIACEKVPIIAETAERIIKLNGFENQIRLVNKTSGELVVKEDLDGPIDVLISEIISSDLLAENVLDTFEDAHARLLRQGATIVPRSATAVGCLAASKALDQYAFVNKVSGFNVSPFTALAPARLPIHGTMTAWRRLSDDFDLVQIDLAAPKHHALMRKLAVDVQEDGQAAGVVQWIRLDLAEGVSFSNHPDNQFDGGWLQVLHTFTRPIPVTKGQQLELMAGHDRTSLAILPNVSTR